VNLVEDVGWLPALPSHAEQVTAGAVCSPSPAPVEGTPASLLAGIRRYRERQAALA
jgi:hypothetical protein